MTIAKNTGCTGRPAIETVNGTMFRSRLIEHLARVGASADRAGLALDLGDAAALDAAVVEVSREARLIETALAGLLRSRLRQDRRALMPNSYPNSAFPLVTVLPGVVHVDRAAAAARLKSRPAPPRHFRGMLEATRDFACHLMLLYQNVAPFTPPEAEPWIAVVGDDLFRSVGPDGFDNASLKTLFNQAAMVGIVTTEAVPEIYNWAATYAALHRLNAVVIETQPEHGDAWLALVREATDAGVVMSVPEETLQ